MVKKLVYSILFIFLLELSGVLAVGEFNVAISNSDNWEEVYSTMLFANLNNADGEFLASTAHGSVLLNGISRQNKILLVSSNSDPFVFNYANTIKSSGFSDVEEIKVKSATLDLINEMPEIKNFVIVGNDYGYNAVAVAPYATLTNSWVFLADRTNIDEINAILSRRSVEKVVIYGYVDREVSTAMTQYNPKVIFTGDKFEDNIQIVKEFLKLNPVEQVVLTNGEFIEKELLMGNNPVLFTGRENVPDQIRDYLKTSDIKVGVLIGNELIGAATNIKRGTGLDVIAKFARGSRSATAGIATVEGLDLFYLPSPRLELKVYSIKYNKAIGQLEVTYKSSSNVPAYLKGTITINSNGEDVRVGDQDPIFIAPGDFKTIVYLDVNLLDSDSFSAGVYTLFGEVESSLDRVLQGDFNISSINIIDSCNLEIAGLEYNKQTEEFSLKVKNLGKVDCWADVELRDVLINNLETTVGSKDTVLVKGGKTGYILIEQTMDETDLKDNRLIETYVYYGERQESLVKLAKGRFEVVVHKLSTITKMMISLAILILILIIIALILKRRDADF